MSQSLGGFEPASHGEQQICSSVCGWWTDLSCRVESSHWAACSMLTLWLIIIILHQKYQDSKHMKAPLRSSLICFTLWCDPPGQRKPDYSRLCLWALMLRLLGFISLHRLTYSFDEVGFGSSCFVIKLILIFYNNVDLKLRSVMSGNHSAALSPHCFCSSSRFIKFVVSLSFQSSLHQRFTTRPNGCRESCSGVNEKFCKKNIKQMKQIS